MKKLLTALLLLAVCVGCAFAEGETPRKCREGHLVCAGTSPEEYADFIADSISNDNYNWVNYDIRMPGYAPYYRDDNGLLCETDFIVQFDSTNEMILALDAGKIDIFELPQPMSKYFLRQGNNADKYIPFVYTQGVDYYLSMGFREGNKWLEPFNAAIKAMNEDDTLLLLKAKYIDYAADDLKPITFESYPDAETVKIAVTGDMPPIDYVAPDGTPAGFNTALLAEIGRRLKVNIQLVSITTGARAAALASGRADGVFWFYTSNFVDSAQDTPSGVVLTEPYYSYDTLVYICRKLH